MKLMSWNVTGKNTTPNLIKLISFSRKSEMFKNTTNLGVPKLWLIKTSTLTLERLQLGWLPNMRSHFATSHSVTWRIRTTVSSHHHHHHHQFLLLLVEHRASMKSFQVLRSPAIPLTSFHDLSVFLISSSIVLCHFLFGLPLLLYPWGFQSNAVFSASLRNVCPIQFHFLLFIWITVLSTSI